MPDPFERLLVVTAASGSITEDARVEPPLARERHAEVSELTT